MRLLPLLVILAACANAEPTTVCLPTNGECPAGCGDPVLGWELTCSADSPKSAVACRIPAGGAWTDEQVCVRRSTDGRIVFFSSGIVFASSSAPFYRRCTDADHLEADAILECAAAMVDAGLDADTGDVRD